jgi:hypothetical protein
MHKKDLSSRMRLDVMLGLERTKDQRGQSMELGSLDRGALLLMYREFLL